MMTNSSKLISSPNGNKPLSSPNKPYVPPPVFATSSSPPYHQGHLPNHRIPVETADGPPSLGSSSEESESDLESIHSYHPPAKVIDIPSAKRLATRLFHLDGFKKTDVSRHLSRNNEYNQGKCEHQPGHYILTQQPCYINVHIDYN